MEPTTQDKADILKEFRSQVVIPNNKVARPFLIAPIGLIGSGKTTIAKKLAHELGLVFISGDDIRALYSHRGLTFVGNIDIELTVVKELLTQGHGVVVDNDCAGISGEIIDEKAGEIDVPILWIHINTSEKQCLENIKNRGITVFGADVPKMIETYNVRKEKFHSKPHEVNFTCVFSGDHKQTDSEVRSCVQKIKSSLNRDT